MDGNNINYDYIIDYLRNIIPKNDELKTIEDYARKNNIPIIEPEVANLITFLIKLKKPKKILELGTAIGYSSLLMFKESLNKVEIDTVERNEDMYMEAIKNIREHDACSNINIIKDEATSYLKKLNKENKKYDLIFIDAAKGHYKEFFNLSKPYLNDRGIIISDNVLFKGMVANDNLVNKRNKTITKRLRNYLLYITNLEGYYTSIIPIGDGVALTYREVDKNE